MLRILSLFLCLFISVQSYSQNNLEDDLKAIHGNYTKVNVEFGALKIERKNLSGDFAGVVSGTVDKGLTKKILDSVILFEERNNILKEEVVDIHERVTYLKENFSEVESVDLQNPVVQETLKAKNEVSKMDNDLSRMTKEMDRYTLEVSKWKNFLSNRIQEDSKKAFSHFKLRETIIHPISQLKMIFLVDSDAILNQVKQEYDHLFDNEGRVQFLGLLIVFFLSLISLMLIFSKTEQAVRAHSFILGGDVSKGVFENVFKNKFIVSLFLSLSILSYFEGPYNEFSVVIFIANLILIPFLWFRCATVLIELVFTEINKSEKEFAAKIPKISFLLFYALLLIENKFTLESDIISFTKDVVLIYLAITFFKLTGHIRAENITGYFKKGSIFLSFLNIFTVFLSFAMAVSAFVSVVGFKNLGNELTDNLFKSVQHLFWGWFIYHLVLDLVINLKNKIQLKEFKEFFDNLIRTMNFMFFILFIYFVANHWAKEFLLVKSLGDVELFFMGGTAVKFSQPFNLVLLFFVYNIVFHLVDASLKLVLDDEPVTGGPRQTAHFSSVLKYVFIAIYIVHMFSILGVTYKNLVIIASALGVGIGFGLQNIVNNFISGIILLFERPVRVGDFIEIDDNILQVKRIGIRSTMVVSFDNSCTVIPNSDILSNRLTNWTLNDNKIGMKCYVGVAYGTDPEVVTTLLERRVLETAGVLQSPPPRVLFTEFGDSSLNFVIKFWVNRPDIQHEVKSRVMHTINKALAEENISIPFPQRDLHIVSTVGGHIE